jgi:ribosome biogenesis protein Nip4
MRTLSFEESRYLLCKMVKYKKNCLILLIEKNKLLKLVYRLQKSRIFEVFLGIVRQTENFQNKQIGSLGTCIARKTHSEKLLLMIPFINVIINHPGTSSVGLTRNGEVLFLRGLHLSQIFLTWASKNLVRGEGVYVSGPSRVILGFGEIIFNLSLDKNMINKKNFVF